MRYHSTRNANLSVDSARAVLEGLAPDGGLYMPEAIPAFDWESCLKGTAQEMSTMILSTLLPEIPDMRTLVSNAYTGKFETEDLTPTVSVGDFTVLELFRGPTSAFKDVALRMLPQLLTTAKDVCGMEKDIMILTATSGDTGKAALAGFQDVPGIKITVFYPDGGVSKVQRAQMVTQEGENVNVCAVRGNFDDAQTGVKNIFAACQGKDMYYFKAYRDLLDAGRIQLGDKINFSVPTGNFGDILAGYIAKLLGLPVGMLICASNANNVLTDFIRTGTYDKRRDLLKTTSPSMDILVSSNLERTLYLLSGNNCELVADLMKQLNTQGVYTVPADLKAAMDAEFWADCCDDEGAAAIINKVWTEHGYLMDTHTASGWVAAENYVNQTGDNRPMVVLSTASPYKFPAAVLEAIGGDLSGDEFDQMERLEAVTKVPAPLPLSTLKGKAERHLNVIDKDKMLEYVLGL